MKVAIRAVIVGCVLSVTPILDAEEAGPPSPPLSPSCSAPAGDIALTAPLPHVAAALEARKTIRVLAIGSSSTAGIGASSPARNYPAQLEEILESTFKGLDVIMENSGVGGEVAATTAARLKLKVTEERPDLVLWQVGTNDALTRVPIDDFKATVADTVRWLKEGQIDTALVGLQYSPRIARDEYSAAVRQAIRQIAEAENVLLVRRFEAMQFIAKANEGDLLSRDDLHLNDLGYHCMAEHIARAVVVSAFLPRKGGLAR